MSRVISSSFLIDEEIELFISKFLTIFSLPISYPFILTESLTTLIIPFSSFCIDESNTFNFYNGFLGGLYSENVYLVFSSKLVSFESKMVVFDWERGNSQKLGGFLSLGFYPLYPKDALSNLIELTDEF